MDSLNIDNDSKPLFFKKINRSYPKLIKTLKKHPNNFDMTVSCFFIWLGSKYEKLL